MMRISFIANPTAGRGRTKAMVESYARAVPGEVEMLWTQRPGHAAELARRAAAGSQVVCAVGGDGTVSEVVNGLMPDPVPLVVVPTGSGNDFASLVDCPTSPAELARVIEAGAGIRMDVIDCGDRWCANSIGIGFEAMVTYHSLTIHNMRGLPLYLAAVFKALRSLDRIRYTVDVDGRVVSNGEYLLISIGNGPRAGGGFYINPRATPVDGKIDVCAAQRMSRLRLLTILPFAIGGGHLEKRGIEFHRGEAITVSSDHPFPIHIDGEYLGRRDHPLHLKMVPKRLPVLCLRGGRILRSQPLERLL
ncbi:MAG TPA: diacylglycerol kinase family protein [Candidatus Krumholzibacteria bacterium]